MTSVIREYNLQYLKKSRLKSGDIFAMCIRNKYIFGRIIRSNLSFETSPFGGSNLVYIYNVRSPIDMVDYSKLTPANLLLPPMFVSNVLWSQGYAKKVTNLEILPKDLLEQHCFYSSVEKAYLDENGMKLDRKYEPCGEWTYVIGLSHIDNKISDALHMLRAPLSEDELSYVSGTGEKIWYKKTIPELKKYSNYEEIVNKYPEVVK